MGLPFSPFLSLWHPLPSWHKFAPNWHKIVWQNAASHMIWARVPALGCCRVSKRLHRMTGLGPLDNRKDSKELDQI